MKESWLHFEILEVPDNSGISRKRYDLLLSEIAIAPITESLQSKSHCQEFNGPVPSFGLEILDEKIDLSLIIKRHEYLFHNLLFSTRRDIFTLDYYQLSLHPPNMSLLTQLIIHIKSVLGPVPGHLLIYVLNHLILSP